MMVSTKGRYALRVMIDLAEHQAEGYIPVSYTHLDVYKRQAIQGVRSGNCTSKQREVIQK